MLYPNTNLSPTTFLQLNTVPIFCDFFFPETSPGHIGKHRSSEYFVHVQSTQTLLTVQMTPKHIYLQLNGRQFNLFEQEAIILPLGDVTLSKVTFFYPRQTILNQLTSFDTAGTPIKSEVQSHQQNRVYITATLITRIWESFFSEGSQYRISHIVHKLFSFPCICMNTYSRMFY